MNDEPANACIDCGAPVKMPKRGFPSKRCPACKEARDAEQRKAYRARHRAAPATVRRENLAKVVRRAAKAWVATKELQPEFGQTVIALWRRAHRKSTLAIAQLDEENGWTAAGEPTRSPTYWMPADGPTESS